MALKCRWFLINLGENQEGAGNEIEKREREREREIEDEREIEMSSTP